MTNQISLLRSEVIEKSIAIEMLINVIISQYYFGMVRKDFFFDFLCDENFTFALKRKILLKIHPPLQPLEQNISRIGTIRNCFAHVGIEIIEGPNPMGSARIPSSRKFSKTVDFESMYTEFIKIEKIVHKELLAAYKSIGGELTEETSADIPSK